MFDFFGKTVAKLFGTKSDRDIKEVLPYVSKVNEEYAKLKDLTDDQLRQKTYEIKGIIDERLKPIDEQIAALHKRIADEPELNIVQKENIFSEIDELEKQRNKDLEVVLMEVLPVGFAVVKETARRWKENGQLVVTATFFTFSTTLSAKFPSAAPASTTTSPCSTAKVSVKYLCGDFMSCSRSR